MPNGVHSGNLTKLPGNKHIHITIPGERKARVVFDKDSLLYLAHTLDRYYVVLVGFSLDPVSVSSLSDDVLKSNVLCYRIESATTFSAVIPCTGFHEYNPYKLGAKKPFVVWKGDKK